MDQKLETVLSELAKKLGTSVEHLYELTTKQVKIELIGKIASGVSWVVLIFVLIIVDIFFSHQQLLIKMQYSTDPTFYGVGFGVLTIAIFVFIIITVVEMSDYFKDIYTMIYNPEYWAFNNILDSIRS